MIAKVITTMKIIIIITIIIAVIYVAYRQDKNLYF